MFRLHANARTVRMGELQIENKTNAEGQAYQSKSILFTVASNRDYSVTKTVNGQQVKERPSDFVFCKAMGNIAQALADYASEKDANGKLVSRFIELAGHLETYTTKRTIPIEKVLTIGGKQYKVNLDTQIDVEQTIFIVKELQFLDSTGSKVKAIEPNSVENMTITEVGAGTEEMSIEGGGSITPVSSAPSSTATNSATTATATTTNTAQASQNPNETVIGTIGDSTPANLDTPPVLDFNAINADKAPF
jgi:hypothetical protein